MKINKLKIFRWIKIIVLLYCGIGIALYYLQERFLFHPTKLATDYAFNFNAPFEEVTININRDETINMVKFFSTTTFTKGVVVYYHGNKENITRYAKFVKQFTNQGYQVWMEDYPSFGKSTGDRTEKKLNQQALQVYKMANAKYASDSIIIYGKSFGTGLAAYVASVTKNKRLILETPYYSIPALFSCYAPIYPSTKMATYKMPTNEYLQQVKYPITIFQGNNDWVVPYRCAAKLKTVLKPIDEFITIDNGNHHNLAEFELYKNKLDSLLKL
jgi:uncharacterized protein